jgi:hypothetical protein
MGSQKITQHWQVKWLVPHKRTVDALRLTKIWADEDFALLDGHPP